MRFFNAFRRSSTFTGVFSSQQLIMTKPRIHLFLDWDGTLSTQDTLATVAKIGYTHHQRNTSVTSLQLPSWENITEAYMEDMKAHQERYKPEAKHRTSVTEELAYLASLKEVERASVQRVVASRIFRGVTRTEIDAVARDAVSESIVQLRPGWADILEDVGRRNGYMAIVSVNWSGEFIKRCMFWANEERGAEIGDGGHTSAELPWFKVCANEIDGLGLRHGAGWLSKDSSEINQEGTSGILTSEDKLRVLERLVDEADTREQRERVEQKATWRQLQSSKKVYVGDSVTDLACLCSDTIDVGICIRDERMGSGQRGLAETLDRVGMKVRSIAEYARTDDDSTSKEKELWWARDFHHILNSPLMENTTQDI
ncbi:MAG: hypothetical protein M1812_006506 [Candelaria pacifica]|nr:MAG: hypothetical protein M1812_006506 [Candelaria pacifica]